VVGKEVEKNIDEFSDRITKITSDARTVKMLKEYPTMMVDYLDERREVNRLRLKEKMFKASLINIEEIETGGSTIGAGKGNRGSGGSRLRQGLQ
jgi:nitrogenase subunit NifH